MALTKVKAGNILLTTPTASSNDVTPATTAYVTTALANLADSAPSTLNTLNELAAALGDDANFSTTVTNSIAAKAPLAGPTFTGDVDIDGSDDLRLRFLSGSTFKGGIQVPTSTGDMISGAAVDDLAIRSQANMLFSSGGNTERMRIDANGKVGIGETSPSAPLDIAATSAGIELQTTDNTSYGYLNFGDPQDNNIGQILYDHASNYMRFQVNNTEKMRIDSSGNLLVGTSTLTPNYNGGIRVHSASSVGNIRVSAGGKTGFDMMADSGGTGYLAVRDNAGMNFYTNDTRQMTITNTGNLLVGTTSSSGSSVKLEAHDATNPIIQVKDTTSNIICGIQAGNSAAVIRCPQDSPLVFNVGASETERMRITSSGTMGFGMQPLGTNSGSAFFDGNVSSKDGFMSTGSDLTLLQPSAGNSIFVRDNGNESMRISSNGRVSIGTTTSSEAKLDIRDAVTGTWITRMENTSAGDGMLLLTAATLNSNSSSNILDIRSGGTGYGTNQAFKVDATNTCYINTTSIWGSAGAHALAIQFSGNKGTGIGFKQYSSSASVQPLVFFNSGAGSAGSITYTYSSTSFNTSSDYRLKEQVQDMPSAINMVKALKPKIFEWKTDPDDTLQYGFLAHEVQDIFPNAVTGVKDAVKPAELDEDGNEIPDSTIDAQSIDHSKLVPLLVKTIQELEARITTLEG